VTVSFSNNILHHGVSQSVNQSVSQSYCATDSRSVTPSVRASWRWAPVGLMTRFWL